jgi:hypothetical protein
LRIKLALLAVAAWLAVAALGAQSASALPGSFSPTGSMTEPRGGAEDAAPLPDGRVLVAGGRAGFGASLRSLQSAEIFRPATGTFSPTGNMTVPRGGAAAAPLPDGRVLVAGGLDSGRRIDFTFQFQILSSAEIFDPATGSFSPTGSMSVEREVAAAAPLPDGRVLVAGGIYYDGNSFQERQSAEIFDPATGSFSPTGSMTVARGGGAAAPLPNGRVLVVAGGGYAEIFDPATGSFSPTGSMINPHGGGAAAPLPDGRVLVAGGGYAEIFDPATGSFAPTGSMTGPYGGAAAPLPDGRVLVTGGSWPSTSAELFTPGLSFTLGGRKLTATVAVAGTLTAADARKRRPSLKPTSASGGPGPITLKLRPTTSAKRRLVRKGKIKVHARLAFAPAPVRGGCVTLVAPCYSRGYAISQSATLTLKAKKRR